MEENDIDEQYERRNQAYEYENEDDRYQEDERDIEEVLEKPNSKIKGDNLCQYLVYTLMQEDPVINSYVSPMYVIGSIEMTSDKTSGYTYSLQGPKYAEIAFGSSFQNTIREIEVKANRPIYVNKYNILAFKNIVLEDDNKVLVKDSNKLSFIWLSAAGNYKTIQVAEGLSIKINSGIYLMSQVKPEIDNDYLVFKGPCDVTIQLKNIRILLRLPPSQPNLSPKPDDVPKAQPQPQVQQPKPRDQQQTQQMQQMQQVSQMQQMQQVSQVQQPTQIQVRQQTEQPEKQDQKDQGFSFMKFFGFRGGGGRINDEMNMRIMLRQI